MERSDSLSMDIYDDESLPSYDAENHPGNDFEQTATQNTPMRYDPISGTVWSGQSGTRAYGVEHIQDYHGKFGIDEPTGGDECQ